MPRTSVAAQTPVGPYPTSVAADDLQLTMTATDVANGNSVTWVGNSMLLILQNTSADTDYYVTLTSVADQFGRLGTITQYDVNFGSGPEVFLVRRPGWQQSDNTLYIDSENAAVKFAVLAI